MSKGLDGSVSQSDTYVDVRLVSPDLVAPAPIIEVGGSSVGPPNEPPARLLRAHGHRHKQRSGSTK